ncbi:MAG: hypothetical protein CSA62_00445 [Planctomycetota bacterium]|nr:MAG: hypothetical protein CSA62_00445 [Planctomycetota bacterium]
MRIAHVIHEFLPEAAAGSSLHLRDLALAQRERGHEPLVFVRAAGSGRAPFSIEEGLVDGLRVARMAYDFHDLRSFERLFVSPRMDASFRAWLERERVELLHFHHLTCLASSLLSVPKRLGLPLVMTLHDYWTQCPRGDRFHPHSAEICEELDRERCVDCLQELWPHVLPGKGLFGLLPKRLGARQRTRRKLAWWEKYMRSQLRLCDAWIAPSRFVLDRFVDWGLDPKRGHAIAHGLRSKELRAKARGKAPIRRLGFIGRMVPSKGLQQLLIAHAALAGQGIQLQVHGEGDTRDPQIRELYAELQRRPGVELRGRFESAQLPEILRGLDCLVVPSIWWEPFGLVAREAALAGIPVVVSNLGGLSEAVQKGLALGYSPFDPGALAQVLQRLLDDAELREQMSRKGPLVRDVAEMAADTDRVYELVLAGELSPTAR